MIKKLHFKWLLLLLMLVGVGTSAWAEDELFYTLDGSISGGNSNYAQDGGGLTQNGMDWSVTANSTIDPWRVGGKNLSEVNREVYSKTPMGSSITKVELEVGAITLTSVNSIKLIVASDNAFGSVIQEITNNNITPNTTLTFTPSGSEWATGAYYKFVFNVTAGNSNSYIQLKSAKFYKDGGDAPSLAESDFALSGSRALSFDLYNISDAQVISYTTSSTGAVTVSTSEYVKAVVNETAKTITVTPTKKTSGAQTITVSQAADDNYKAGSATFTVTITDSTPYVQPTTIEIVPNYEFWGKTAQFSGSDNSELSGEQDNVTLEWSRGSGSTYANQNAMRFYKDNTLTFTAPNGYEIKSIVLDGTLQNDLTFSPKGFDLESKTWTGSSETVTMSRPSNASSYATISKYTITIGTPSTLVTPTVTINDAGITNTDVYNGTEAGNLSADITYNDAAVEGATVTWSGNNDEVATINASTGAVTLVAAGSVTFTATFAGNEDYNEATATYQMTVTNSDPNGPGTQNNPYTVAQAIAATPTTGEVYISGIVSSFFKDDIVSDGTNYRYYISDGGTTTTQLLVYKGKGLEQADFSDADDLKVGDEVTIYGKLIMYNDAPEVASGNYLVSWNRPASITVANATVSVDADEPDGTMTIAYENLTISDMTDFYVQFYNAEGVELTEAPSWIEALVAEQDPSVGEGYVLSYIVEANDGDARTAYLKIYASDDEDNVVYSNLITITQAAYVAPEETIGTFVKVTSTDDITSGQYLIVYEEGSVAFNGSLETLDAASNTIDVVINDGVIAATTTNAQSVFNIDVTAGTLQSASGKYIGVTSYGNGLKTSEDATAFNHTFSIDNDENAVIALDFDGSTMTLRYNSDSGQKRFRYYKSGQKAIQLYKFVADEEDDVTVTITSAGYATYCSEKDLDFSNTDLKAYKAILNGSEVSFTEVKQVPAGQGVLLKGDEGTYTVPVAANASALTGNAFIGVTEETLINETGIFVLLNGEQGVGFYKTTASSFTVGAHTAYIAALPSGARNFIAIDGEATAIKAIENKQQSGEIYNLAGQRVKSAQKGLYIIDGKKVVIK